MIMDITFAIPIIKQSLKYGRFYVEITDNESKYFGHVGYMKLPKCVWIGIPKHINDINKGKDFINDICRLSSTEYNYIKKNTLSTYYYCVKECDLKLLDDWIDNYSNMFCNSEITIELGIFRFYKKSNYVFCSPTNINDIKLLTYQEAKQKRRNKPLPMDFNNNKLELNDCVLAIKSIEKNIFSIGIINGFTADNSKAYLTMTNSKNRNMIDCNRLIKTNKGYLNLDIIINKKLYS